MATKKKNWKANFKRAIEVHVKNHGKIVAEDIRHLREIIVDIVTPAIFRSGKTQDEARILAYGETHRILSNPSKVLDLNQGGVQLKTE